MYAAFLGISSRSEKCGMDIFHQPPRSGFFETLAVRPHLLREWAVTPYFAVQESDGKLLGAQRRTRLPRLSELILAPDLRSSLLRRMEWRAGTSKYGVTARPSGILFEIRPLEKGPGLVLLFSTGLEQGPFLLVSGSTAPLRVRPKPREARIPYFRKSRQNRIDD
jgi:hypothetical protein